MKRIQFASFCVLASTVAANAWGIDRMVPSSYPTIQSAIDACSNGDRVLVAPGVYSEFLNFQGKAIVVTSEETAGETILDGINPFTAGTLVTFDHGEGTESVLSGFTLRNGGGTLAANGYYYGGAILCSNTSPTIQNNRIEISLASFGGGIACVSGAEPWITKNRFFANGAISGGAIFCDMSSPKIAENSFEENSATVLSWGFGGDGAGIFCRNGSLPQIENNDFYLNLGGRGGAIACRGGSDALIQGNTMRENAAYFAGGGIFADASSPLVAGNKIEDCITEFSGGGIACENGARPLIRKNLIRNCHAHRGGGIYATYSVPSILANRIEGCGSTSGGGIYICNGQGCEECDSCPTVSEDVAIANNILWHNGSNGPGGGAFVEGRVRFLHNTVVANESSDAGGGLAFIPAGLSPGEKSLVSNCIFWENEGTYSAQIDASWVGLTVEYSTVQGGTSGLPGLGNLIENPSFEDLLLGDFHLRADSPARNTGTLDLPDLPAHDFETDPRVHETFPDMGADEFFLKKFPSQVLYHGAP